MTEGEGQSREPDPGPVLSGEEFEFVVQNRSGAARAGMLITPNGTILTPAFMPVASRAAVWGLGPGELRSARAMGLMVNALHLAERPGVERIERSGGLHEFMGWSGLLASDSGGFQMVSLAEGVDVNDEGMSYRSPYDGQVRRLTPESSIRDQERLGADLIYCLDDLASPGSTPSRLEQAVVRTTAWARRAVESRSRSDQMLVGVVQGATDLALRERSATELSELGIRAFGIGGLSLGEPRDEMLDVAGSVCEVLPDDAPRHLLGVGDVEGITGAVRRGVDMFDSVLPVRLGRHGTAITWKGRLDLKRGRYRGQEAAIDSECNCIACSWHSRAYLHYLLRRRDPLAGRVIAMHNLHLVLGLMGRLRAAILAA